MNSQELTGMITHVMQTIKMTDFLILLFHLLLLLLPHVLLSPPDLEQQPILPSRIKCPGGRRGLVSLLVGVGGVSNNNNYPIMPCLHKAPDELHTLGDKREAGIYERERERREGERDGGGGETTSVWAQKPKPSLKRVIMFPQKEYTIWGGGAGGGCSGGGED